MKKIITVIYFFYTFIIAQSWFSLPSHWQLFMQNIGYNIETHDINKDGKQDIIVGNWNDTYVYFGGKNILDTAKDVVYNGRCLAILDYNGDGYKDMIAMHFTRYDSTRWDYDGNLLFYWGSNNSSIAIDTNADFTIPLPTLYPIVEMFSFGRLGSHGVQIGDFNSDGKKDIVFNSSYYNGGRGRVYIYLGKSVPQQEPDFILSGENIPYQKYEREFGYYFGIGKINNDNYDDLLISSTIRKIPPGNKDSLDVLYVFLGSSNFRANKDSASLIYSSKVDYTLKTSGWFRRKFSVEDVNGDGRSDLIIGGMGLMINNQIKDSTFIHYSNTQGIDTIPSFILIDPDTTDPTIKAGSPFENIGDFNKDGYDDFAMVQPMNSFSLHLGGPYISNKNPYGLRGFTEAPPAKIINVNDQNGDGFKEIVAVGNRTLYGINFGYVDMMYGQNVKTEIKEIVKEINFKLKQNYPNPFNSQTKIEFELNKRSNVKVYISDILGRKIVELLNKEKSSGHYTLDFKADDYNLASGIYFCHFIIGQYNQIIKIILLK